MDQLSKTFYLKVSGKENILVSNTKGAQIPIAVATQLVIVPHGFYSYEIYMENARFWKVNGKPADAKIYQLGINQNLEVGNTSIQFGPGYLRVKFFESLPSLASLQFLSENKPDLTRIKKYKTFSGVKIKRFEEPQLDKFSLKHLFPSLLVIVPYIAMFMFTNSGFSMMFLMISGVIVSIISGIITHFTSYKINKRKYQNAIKKYQAYLDSIKPTKYVPSEESFFIRNEEQPIEVDTDGDLTPSGLFKINTDKTLSLRDYSVEIRDNNNSKLKQIILDNLVANPKLNILVITQNLNDWRDFKLSTSMVDVVNEVPFSLERYNVVVSDFSIDLEFSGLKIQLVTRTGIVVPKTNESINLLEPQSPNTSENIGETMLALTKENQEINRDFKSNFFNFFGFNYDENSLIENWQQNKRGLKIPVGTTINDEKFFLDLDQSADGPHMIVTGTTGSGKTEFLLTYLYSLALNYSPSKVGFLVIDFKGGGLSDRLNKLPHILGSFTNLDIADVKRSFYFIEQEVKNRQAIFRNLNISDIDQLPSKTNVFVPHIFIVADEFAELKFLAPEFLEQLNSLGRIGRSLGIHLILSTQKASGVISDAFLSNVATRIAFRSQTTDESMFLVERPDAKNISRPGQMIINKSKTGEINSVDVFSMSSLFVDRNFVPTNTQTIFDKSNDLLQHQQTKFKNIIPENLSDFSGDVVAKEDDLEQPEVTIDWQSINSLLIIGSAAMGKTTGLNTLIRDSSFENIIVISKNYEMFKNEPRVVLSIEKSTEELIDKIDYFMESNLNSVLVLDDLDLILDGDFYEQVQELINKFSILAAVSSTNLSSKITDRFDHKIYLGNLANQVFKKYDIPNIAGRGVFANSKDQKVIQLAKEYQSNRPFIKPNNSIRLLPNKVNFTELVQQKNKYPLGLEYQSVEPFNIEISNGQMNILLYEKIRDVFPIINNLKHHLPEIYFLDPSGINWQYKNQFQNYVTEIDGVPQNSVVVISDLESFINKYGNRLDLEMLNDLSLIIFSEARYFNHSFDSNINIFRMNANNVVEIKEDFAIVNDKTKVKLAI